MMVALLALPAGAQELRHNAQYPDDPAFVPVADSLKGLILSGEFNDSKIYPATRREWKVYVPVQYDGTTPACLLVGLDGILFNATTVLDNLIASGEMPVTIGVFVQPGVSYDADGNVLRYNRSNEFDRTDGTFARFLETEILPMVERLVTPDGRPVRLSHNPDDRAITGASSSGICAFTAAWERPDLFHRVYSSVGTYVAMRGGNDYPAWIRKCEPKPLRIFLQDGMKDAWNPLFGEWWEQNLLMESALDFAGYEEIAHWDRGGHSIWHGTRMFPDAMRWLWKGWPTPVRQANRATTCCSRCWARAKTAKRAGRRLPLKRSRAPSANGWRIPSRYCAILPANWKSPRSRTPTGCCAPWWAPTANARLPKISTGCTTLTTRRRATALTEPSPSTWLSTRWAISLSPPLSACRSATRTAACAPSSPSPPAASTHCASPATRCMCAAANVILSAR